MLKSTWCHQPISKFCGFKIFSRRYIRWARQYRWIILSQLICLFDFWFSVPSLDKPIDNRFLRSQIALGLPATMSWYWRGQRCTVQLNGYRVKRRLCSVDVWMHHCCRHGLVLEMCGCDGVTGSSCGIWWWRNGIGRRNDIIWIWWADHCCWFWHDFFVSTGQL